MEANFCKLCMRPNPHKESPDEVILYWCEALPQPFPLYIDPQPSPVVRLITETLGLRCQVLGLVVWNTTLVDMDGHPFLKRFDVRDKAGVRYRSWAHDKPSQSGRRIPSTISRF
jgi:hypothetical protein